MDNRQKIMDTAGELFHSFGYAGTSVDMLIESAGVSRSNFYYHFRGKEELGLRIIEDLVSRYERETISETLLNPDLAPPERLQSFYARIIAYHKALSRYQGCVFGNLALEQSGINENFRSVLSGFFRRWKKSVARCVREGVEEGFFRRKIDPDAMADLVISQIEGAILLSKTHRSMDALEKTCGEIMKLMTRQRRKAS